MKKEFQAIIIGAGPAGLSCALELEESKIDYVLVDRNPSIGGQLREVPNTIRDFAGGFYENGKSLMAQMEDLADRMEINLALNQNVYEVNLQEGRLVADNEELTTRCVIIATGLSRRRLNLPEESSFGDDVAYVLWGREEHFRDKPVAVVGGGDSALLDALELANNCPVVYLIHRSVKFKARRDVIEEVRNNPRIRLVADSRVEALQGDGSLSGLSLVSTATGDRFDIEVNRLLIKVGYAPNTGLFKGQLDMDPSGFIRVGSNLATSVPGVFAAGDVTAGAYWRLAVAIGQGSLAGYSVRQYLTGG